MPSFRALLILDMKKIELSNNKILGGVCAGFARLLDIKPIYLRLLAVVAVFFSGGTVILVYIICWIIIPDESETTEEFDKRMHEIYLKKPEEFNKRMREDHLKKPTKKSDLMVVLTLILFGISPIIIGIVAIPFIGAEKAGVFHWLVIFTAPIAGVSLLIYVIIRNINRSRQG